MRAYHHPDQAPHLPTASKAALVRWFDDAGPACFTAWLQGSTADQCRQALDNVTVHVKGLARMKGDDVRRNLFSMIEAFSKNDKILAARSAAETIDVPAEEATVDAIEAFLAAPAAEEAPAAAPSRYVPLHVRETGGKPSIVTGDGRTIGKGATLNAALAAARKLGWAVDGSAYVDAAGRMVWADDHGCCLWGVAPAVTTRVAPAASVEADRAARAAATIAKGNALIAQARAPKALPAPAAASVDAPVVFAPVGDVACPAPDAPATVNLPAVIESPVVPAAQEPTMPVTAAAPVSYLSTPVDAPRADSYVNRADVKAALAIAGKAVPKNVRIPILAHTLFRPAVDGGVELVSTDLDVTVTTRVEGYLAAPVTLATHEMIGHEKAAGPLVNAIQVGMPAQAAYGDGLECALRLGALKVKAATFPASDFPIMADLDGAGAFTIPVDDFERALATVAPTMSTEATRYYLNGVALRVKGPRGGEWDADGTWVPGPSYLDVVSTDGHRLTRVALPLPAGAESISGENGLGIIIPRLAVTVMQAVMAQPRKTTRPAAVTIRTAGKRIEMAYGPHVVTAKLVDAQFPEYERVIPAGNDKRVTVSRVTLAAAVRQVGTISPARGRAVKLDVASAMITASVNNPDAGTATLDIPTIGTLEGAPITIGVNNGYLIDYLAAMDGDAVTLTMGDSGSPILLSDSARPDVTRVLMPMRVS